MLIVLLLLTVIFLPAIIALRRNYPNTLPIFLLNVLGFLTSRLRVNGVNFEQNMLQPKAMRDTSNMNEGSLAMPKKTSPDKTATAQINQGVVAFLDAANIEASGSGTHWNLYRVMQAICQDPVFNVKVHRLLGLPIPLPSGLWCKVTNAGPLKQGTWVLIEDAFGLDTPAYAQVFVKALRGKAHHLLPLDHLDLETLQIERPLS